MKTKKESTSSFNLIYDDNDMKCMDDFSMLDPYEYTVDIILHGQIDILLHPAFQVPCPYIRMWDSSGSYLTAEKIQLFLDNYSMNRKVVNQEDHSLDIAYSRDHRVHIFGRLYDTEHPNEGHMCSSIHVCDIDRYLQSKQVLDSDISLGNFMLSWFSLMSSHIGLSISPAEFLKCSELMNIPDLLLDNLQGR